MQKPLVYLLTVALLFIACGKETSEEQIAENLNDKGTMDLLKEAGEEDYDPPEDGKLVDDQLDMYIEVREREVAIAKVAREQLKEHGENIREKGDKSVGGLMDAFKGMGAAADLATADIRAAQELGHNTKEYLWVKSRILEAGASEYREKSNAKLAILAEQAYENVKKQHDATTDEATKEMYAKLLEQADKNRKSFAESQKPDEALEHNKALLADREEVLKSLAYEMSKWTGEANPDETEEQLKKNLDAVGAAADGSQ